MKRIILLIAVISMVSILSHGQDDLKLKPSEVSIVLKIYRTDVVPYLDELVEREMGTPQTATDVSIKVARRELFGSKIDFVEKDVIDYCLLHNVSDPIHISGITAVKYRDYFTGIRKEFYDNAKNEIRNRKF